METDRGEDNENVGAGVIGAEDDKGDGVGDGVEGVGAGGNWT